MEYIDVDFVVSNIHTLSDEDLDKLRKSIERQATRNRPKRYALWRCKICKVFHVRGSRRIEYNDGEWAFTDTIQSPCPKCNENGTPYRQRMQPMNVRLYLTKKEAEDAKQLYSQAINHGVWF